MVYALCQPIDTNVGSPPRDRKCHQLISPCKYVVSPTPYKVQFFVSIIKPKLVVGPTPHTLQGSIPWTPRVRVIKKLFSLANLSGSEKYVKVNKHVLLFYLFYYTVITRINQTIKLMQVFYRSTLSYQT